MAPDEVLRRTRNPESAPDAREALVAVGSGPTLPTSSATVSESLRPLLENWDGGVMLAGSSGATCWDSAIERMLRPGDRVLVAGAGPEADKWAGRARRVGLDVVRGSTTWGEPPSASELSYLLWWDPSIKAVFVVHTDLGNGATVDVAQVRRAIDATGSAALLLVDVSGSIGTSPVHQSEWRVDVAVAGSDRGLLGIAGASAVSLSPRAVAMWAADPGQQTPAGGVLAVPSLPPVPGPLLTALEATLTSIHDEGLPDVLARHARIAGAVRAAVGAWGLPVCAEAGNESPASTAIVLPAGIDATSLATFCEQRFALRLEAWASHPRGSVVMLRHHGAYFEKTCFGDVSVLELSLRSLGLPVTPGMGVEAACEYLRASDGGVAA